MQGDDDHELFREAVADARPVRDPGKVLPERPKPSPLPIHSRRDEDAALEETLNGPDGLSDEIELGDAQSYLRDGLPRKVLRDLAHGRWTVQDRLDLHGLRVDEARRAVVQFLAAARRRGLRCVCVIHGRGLGSAAGEPVLRSRVRAWLL
ncbi:MAG: Smr/MutS family protein, partial [Pseudomonadota bacterium]|nr:Smr/MutS family protein [Pseudomonadota bacterium]